MFPSEKDFCFCSLALGKKYRTLAKQLAAELDLYSPGTSLVLYTDAPEDFSNNANVLAFHHQSQGILYCFHDRRFVLEKALSLFRAAIHIDIDTKILAPVPEIHWQPGLTSGKDKFENIIHHLDKVEQYRGISSPQEREAFTKLAAKLGVSLAETYWVQEALYIVARDDGKEREFLEVWGRIGQYLELKGIHRGDGNAIGLAAAKVGWTIQTEGFQELVRVRKHLDASKQEKQPVSVWEKLRLKLRYHYRLNQARVRALADFEFYYR